MRSQLDDLTLAAALRARITDMQQRLSRLEQRAEKKRALITSTMERANLRKLTEPDFTISLRSTHPPLILVDEHNIPEDFWKPQPPKLDRQGLIAALSLDRAGKTEVTKFYERHGIRYLRQHLDPTWRSAVLLGVMGLPTTLLIDARGNELGRVIGPAEWDSDVAVALIRRTLDDRPTCAATRE